MVYETCVRTPTNIFIIFGNIFIGKINNAFTKHVILPRNICPKITKTFVNVRTYVLYNIFLNQYDRSKTVGLSTFYKI